MAKDIQPQFNKTVPFEVYRYQLVVNKAIQLSLDNQFQSPEQIRENKNKIFQDLIANPQFHFTASKSETTSKLVFSKGDISIFKLAVRRSLKHDKKDFTEETIDNYPKLLIGINNNPAVQKIAIQENKKAFSQAHAVSRIIEQSVESKIRKENLSFSLLPLYDKKEFWDLVGRYQGRITQLTFDLVSPNMANISKDLKVNLREFYEDTNTHKTKIELTSDKGSHLEIKNDSKLVNSLVDYSAEGGGNIAMRVAGYTKKFHTAQSITEFSVEENLIKGNDWDALNDLFSEILI